MGKKKIKMSKGQIWKLRGEGKKWQEIADMCGCSRQGLYFYLTHEQHDSKLQKLINGLEIDKPLFIDDPEGFKISSLRSQLYCTPFHCVSKWVERGGKKGLWICRVN